MPERQVSPNFKAPKPKRPQRQRQNWSGQCDIYMGRLVRARGRCEVCGTTTGVLQWAHGFSRRYRNVRWDERNGFCACARCHWKYTHDPERWTDWLKAMWGEDLYAEIRGLALSDDKAHKPNTKALAKTLRERWEQYVERTYGEAS